LGLGLATEEVSAGLNRKLRDIVASKLILDWSPEQISGWLETQYPDDESLRVSTKPSTAACSFRPWSAEKELLDSCGRSGACAVRAMQC